MFFIFMYGAPLILSGVDKTVVDLIPGGLGPDGA
jgi:hypothetical protein